MHPRAKKRTSQGPLNVASGTTRRHSPRRQDTLFFRHSLEKRSTESAYADPFLFFELLGGARALAVGGRNSCSDAPTGDPLARIGPTNGRESGALSDAIEAAFILSTRPFNAGARPSRHRDCTSRNSLMRVRPRPSQSARAARGCCPDRHFRRSTCRVLLRVWSRNFCSVFTHTAPTPAGNQSRPPGSAPWHCSRLPERWGVSQLFGLISGDGVVGTPCKMAAPFWTTIARR